MSLLSDHVIITAIAVDPSRHVDVRSMWIKVDGGPFLASEGPSPFFVDKEAEKGFVSSNNWTSIISIFKVAQKFASILDPLLLFGVRKFMRFFDHFFVSCTKPQSGPTAHRVGAN